jgi:hypothetical protein
MTRYSERKKALRVREQSRIGVVPVLLFVALCILSGIVGTYADRALTHAVDAWIAAHRATANNSGEGPRKAK